MAQEPEQKQMVGMDEERGRGHETGSQGLSFHQWKSRLSSQESLLGLGEGIASYSQLPKLAPARAFLGEWTHRPWPVHSAGAPEPWTGATVDTHESVGTSGGGPEPVAV